MSAERWAEHPAYPGLMVSDCGRVVSRLGRELAHTIDRDGYHRVAVWRNNRGASRGVHALVLEAFVGLPAQGQVVRHLDGNPANNALENLAWGTHLENAQDRERHGRTARGDRHPTKLYGTAHLPRGAAHQTPARVERQARGERQGSAKLTEQAVREIRRSSDRPEIIASQFGVSKSLVYQVRKGLWWRHVV